MKAKCGLAAVVLVILCASCGKQSASSFAASGASRGVSAQSAANDYTKSYLTDDKMQKFLNSMNEGKNPFDFLFGKSGKATNLATLPLAVSELDAFARKYGFDGYTDYTAVWGRIAAGEAAIMGEEMMKGARDSMESSIQSNQEQLKKPDLSPEMRKMYEEQLASAQKSLDEMKQSDSHSGLNEADFALVKKYKEQIEQAEKKYGAQK